MSASSQSHRPGPLIAIGVAALLVLAVTVGVMIGGDDASPLAIRVDGTEISQKTFHDQLQDLAPTLRDQQESAGQPVTVTDSRLPSAFAAQLASLLVATELVRDDLTRRGVTVTAADRQAYVAANREQLAEFSGSARDVLVDVGAYQTAFVGEVGEESAGAAFGRLAQRADVHVDPRYGFWNAATGEVCPPTGCVAQQQPGG